MILGIGADLCRIDRIRFSYERLGGAWTDELFTTNERAWCLATSDPGLAFAKAFSCKEACAKALGTGFARGVGRRDIEISIEGSVAAAALHGAATRRMRRLAPRATNPSFLVTISNTELFVSSIVLIQDMRARGHSCEGRR